MWGFFWGERWPESKSWKNQLMGPPLTSQKKIWPLKLLRRVTEFQNPRQEKLFFDYLFINFKSFRTLSLLCFATEIEILGFSQNCDFPKLQINNLDRYLYTYIFLSYLWDSDATTIFFLYWKWLCCPCPLLYFRK